MRKYTNVVRIIEDGISNGLFQDRLPSEKKLAQEYDVSINTIRKALEILIQKGLIISRHGSGYYINSLFDIKLMNSLSVNSLAASYPDSTIINKVLLFDLKRASNLEAESLGIQANDIIYKIKRLRLIDGVPSVLENTIVPYNLLPDLSVEILEGSLFNYVETQTAQTIDRAVKEIHSTLLTKNDAELLNLDMQTPVLLIKNSGFLKNGVQYEFSVDFIVNNGVSVVVKR